MSSTKHLIIDSLGHEQAVSEEEYVLKRREAVEATDRLLSEREKIIEAMARAIAFETGCGESEDVSTCDPKHCACRRAADKSLAAISSQGYVVVPRVATCTMSEAADASNRWTVDEVIAWGRSFDLAIAFSDIARPVPDNAEKA